MQVWTGSEAEWLQPPGHYGDLVVSDVVDWQAGRTFQVQSSELAPDSGKALHTHDDAAQLYVILEGELRFDTGAQRLVLRPGQAILFEPGDPHAIHNDSSSVGRVLVTTVRVGG